MLLVVDTGTWNAGWTNKTRIQENLLLTFCICMLKSMCMCICLSARLLGIFGWELSYLLFMNDCFCWKKSGLWKNWMGCPNVFCYLWQTLQLKNHYTIHAFPQCSLILCWNLDGHSWHLKLLEIFALFQLTITLSWYQSGQTFI